MDHYDIFKKITQGCNFRRKPTSVTLKLSNTKIKQEVVESQLENVQDTSIENKELTLLGSIKSSSSTKRKKLCDDGAHKRHVLFEQEKINQYRNENNISVVGRHIADPIKSFQELQIGTDLKENIRKCGYIDPTPIQKQSMPVMLKGRQLLACAPTGSGMRFNDHIFYSTNFHVR